MTLDDRRLPDEFAWTTDGCPRCGSEHFAQGCAAVLPVALIADDDGTVVLAYRCMHGHDWTTGYDRGFAIEHAVASRRELAGGQPLPHFPAAVSFDN